MSSCGVWDVRIVAKLGNQLHERIDRAVRNDEVGEPDNAEARRRNARRRGRLRDASRRDPHGAPGFLVREIEQAIECGATRAAGPKRYGTRVNLARAAID